MGCAARKSLTRTRGSLSALLSKPLFKASQALGLAMVASTALAAHGPARSAASIPRMKADLKTVKNEINNIERDLLQSKESQSSASTQLKKIRHLLALQQKEIQLSKKRIAELGESWSDLSAQKQALLDSIDKKKITLKRRLRELAKLAETEALDASWLSNIDSDNQKTYFLSKNLKKDLERVNQLKHDAQATLALELKILEEKSKIDYYVQDLGSQSQSLHANESIYKEVLRTNHASRLEALARMRSLKESERALEELLAGFRAAPQQQPVVMSKREILTALEPIEAGLAAQKGHLPYPVSGPVTSQFGKSFNPKTNLLTFQKGITIGAAAMSQVKAVAPGKAVFAGPLKNYGLVVILEHPGQYFTLYGQMGKIDVQCGTTVAQGDLIGHTAGENLYFEIRDRNVAINPLQWLLNGSMALVKRY